MVKIYDEVCGWPYHQPYGMVTAPKVKRPRKPRKSRAKSEWLAAPQKVSSPKAKKERTHGPSHQRRPSRRSKLVVEAPAEVRQATVLEASPQI